MKLIDKFLPDYDVHSRYHIVVDAPLDKVYTAAKEMDLSGSWLVRTLYRLRGLPESALTLEGMEKTGFVKLGEVGNKEVLLGLVGQFWKLSGGVIQLKPDAFTNFDKPGYARTVFNFEVEPINDKQTRLLTETRVKGNDPASTRKFKRYWTVINTFSGFIRKVMLDAIKQKAEALKP